MLSPDDALAGLIAAAKPIALRSFTTLDARGLVLAESVRADRDYPPFPRAMMDGYAVRVVDAGRQVRTGLLSGNLIETVQSRSGRARFLPGRVEWRASHWQLKPLPGASSTDIFTTAAAKCYLHVPGDRGTLDAGETVAFSLLSLP